MSNLLKEAIVDAKALKEAALKNAEASIIEKYSTEVKQTFDKLLEQDDLGLGMGGEGDLGAMEEPALGGESDLLAAPGGIEDPAMAGAPQEDIIEDDDVPLAAADGISDKTSKPGDQVKFDLDLGALQEAISELQATQQMIEEEAELDVSEEEIFEILAEEEHEEEEEEEEEEEKESEEDQPEGSKKKIKNPGPYKTGAELGYDDDGDGIPDGADSHPHDGSKHGKKSSKKEQLDLDGLVDAITEKLTVDMGADLAGWAGRSSEDKTYQIEKEMAYRRNTDVEEELKDLKKAHEELVFENKQLQEQLLQYKQATNELKEGLQDVNLSNARLLYTNRVLRNTSLNERQKETIVEAISKAGSVAEARTILDTLQSTVQSTPKRGPKSLNEAITRRSSVIRASRHEKSDSSDPFQDRMKRLAGIKK